jgi:hypothetical protein
METALRSKMSVLILGRPCSPALLVLHLAFMAVAVAAALNKTAGGSMIDKVVNFGAAILFPEIYLAVHAYTSSRQCQPFMPKFYGIDVCAAPRAPARAAPRAPARGRGNAVVARRSMW